MSHEIRGEFTVKLSPQPLKGGEGDTILAMMSIDKQFTGGMVGSSWGHMLSARCPAGGAGYVAQEQVAVSIDGRQGGFVLQHSGLMSAAGQRLTITVVPDSGSGDLTGISGSMNIDIKDGNHFYSFSYSLPTT